MYYILLNINTMTSHNTKSYNIENKRIFGKCIIKFPEFENKLNSDQDFLVGYSQCDITPKPLLYMSGYSICSKRSLGRCMPLTATVFYIEDHNGSISVFVSVEIWAVSEGMLDVIASKLQYNYGLKIGKQNIFLAATHTHNGGGNINSNSYCNKFSSNTSGFNKKYFDHITTLISHSIKSAFENKKQHNIYYGKHVLNNICRNRSMVPFKQNPDSKAILKHNENILSPTHNNKKNYAINPFTRILYFQKDTKVTGMLIFMSIHPIVTGMETSLYTSDILGVARILLQEKYNIKVGFIQGAQGDITPNVTSYSRKQAYDFGKIIADKISIEYEKNDRSQISGTIDLSHTRVNICDQDFEHKHEFFDDSPNDTKQYRTAKEGISGFGMIGGSAEDARTPYYKFGWKGGHKTRIQIDSEQAEKREPFDYFGIAPGMCGNMRRMYTGPISPPKSTCLTTMRLGNILFATAPGEFTFTNQYRFEQIMKNIDNTLSDCVLLGLTNNYINYFATSHEYELQYYEGASTVYGKYSSCLILSELGKLFTKKSNNLNKIHKYNYEHLGYRVRQPITYYRRHIKQKIKNMVEGSKTIRTKYSTQNMHYPFVCVFIKKDGAWKALKINNIPQTSEYLNILMILRNKSPKVYIWDIIWIIPDNYQITENNIRFVIDGKMLLPEGKIRSHL